jgi:MFS family permease
VDSSVAYVILAGIYLVGAIVGMLLGTHIGEAIGRRWEKPIAGILIGAAVGGTLGCAAMYGLTRWGLGWALGMMGGGDSGFPGIN